MGKIRCDIHSRGVEMIKLKYHLDSDYSLARYGYVINLLKEVNENICPVEFIKGLGVYFEIYMKYEKFAKKGLLTPREAFRSRSGGYYLDNSLFLYVDDVVEYYWKGDEKALEEILKGGKEYLLKLAEGDTLMP